MAYLASVVIPNRNSPAHYLTAALGSVAAQSVGAEAIEVVLVDDYSSVHGRRQVADAVDRARRRFPALSVSVVSNDLAPGLGNARNVGLSVAGAEVVGCLDADDMLRGDAIEKSLEVLSSGSYDIVFSDYEKRDRHMRVVLYAVCRSEVYHAHCRYKGTLLDPLVHGSFTELFTVVRKASAAAVGYRNIECPDYDFPLRASALAREVNFGHVPEVLYFYRDNPHGLTNRPAGFRNAANRVVEAYLLEFLHRSGHSTVTSVRLLHEAPGESTFFDVITGDGPVEVPWFDRAHRRHLFARYFVPQRARRAT